MDKRILLIAAVLTVIGAYIYFSGQSTAEISSFENCAKAGYPILESYPPQCRTPDGRTFTEESCAGLTLSDARTIAKASECGDRLKETRACNEGTKTWWIDLDLQKEGCAPACVIWAEERRAEINWRCTGLAR